MNRIALPLVMLTAIGWAAFWGVSSAELFGEIPKFRDFIFGIGLSLSAITIVLFLAEFFLKTILRDAFQTTPSGLVSAIVYSTLAIISTVALLGQFGVDVGAILTTSAIVGAVVGLSMQSTLGSIIAGMSMSAEPLLKIGSAIRFENRTVTIEQKTWRHIVGRRLDNIRVIIPNSTLANMPILVLPEDGPTRFDVFIHLPPDVPPQHISDLLSGAFTDLENLDATRAVMVTPIETLPELDSIKYRIRLWARVHSQVTILQGEVLRRAWYVLGRSRIHQPRHVFYESPTWIGTRPAALERFVRSSSKDDVSPEALASLRQFRFAPAEVLQFPASQMGKTVLIIKGQVGENSNPYFNLLEHGRRARPHLPAMNVQKLTTSANIRKIADRLALDAGPIAEQLVRDAIRTSRTLDGALTVLSQSISADDKRNDFLADTQNFVRSDQFLGRGFISTLSRDATGRVVPNPELRAISEVLVATYSKGD